jgi:hypothetical protein
LILWGYDYNQKEMGVEYIGERFDEKDGLFLWVGVCF